MPPPILFLKGADPASLDKRDVLIGLAMSELAGLISDPASRQAMERSSATLMRSAIEKIATEVEQR